MSVCRVLLLLLCVFSLQLQAVLLSPATRGLRGKTLVFPTETDNSYVILSPQKPFRLSAFTLCMRLATELPIKRDTILFAYRSPAADALTVWREKDGRFSLYLSGPVLFFQLPPLSTLKTHMCITWESSFGLATFWVDGKNAARQVFQVGHIIQPDGTALLGQDADSYLGKFEKSQSFVGEISDLHLWDYVLPKNVIETVACGEDFTPGNIFDWNVVEYDLKGNVIIAPN